jgi:UDP-galactopyranose mutase
MNALLQQLFQNASITTHVRWYYTPMSIGWMRGLPAAAATVYDCMDELSAFRGAPPELLVREAAVFHEADVVFAGGQSLYEAKRRQHANVHLFPSSVDVSHFGKARMPQPDPSDQAPIPHPRLGFFGVLDERLDLDLLAGMAELQPDWHIVLIGPVVKIDPSTLPRSPNLHYLGARDYAELPAYIANWDVALIPFARNESTRFISPTKTPEYLAAGRPVVSTSIRDVVRPYADEGLVRIADAPDTFIAAAAAAMRDDRQAHHARVDPCLASMSWDTTWSDMNRLIDSVLARRVQAGVEVAA